jgi:hypothetical protein
LDSEPFISFEFAGGERFVIQKVTLSSELEQVITIRQIGDQLLKRPRNPPKLMKFEAMSGREIFHTDITFQGGRAALELTPPIACSRVTLTMIGPCQNGGKVLRLRSVQFVGHFLPQ